MRNAVAPSTTEEEHHHLKLAQTSSTNLFSDSKSRINSEDYSTTSQHLNLPRLKPNRKTILYYGGNQVFSFRSLQECELDKYVD